MDEIDLTAVQERVDATLPYDPDASCITLVTGATRDEVLRALGGDPAAEPIEVEQAFEDGHEAVAALFEVPSGVVAVEFNGYEGSRSDRRRRDQRFPVPPQRCLRQPPRDLVGGARPAGRPRSTRSRYGRETASSSCPRRSSARNTPTSNRGSTPGCGRRRRRPDRLQARAQVSGRRWCFRGDHIVGPSGWADPRLPGADGVHPARWLRRNASSRRRSRRCVRRARAAGMGSHSNWSTSSLGTKSVGHATVAHQ